jgi:hypothetical protein
MCTFTPPPQTFDLAIAEGTLYVSLGEETLTGTIEERRLAN